MAEVPVGSADCKVLVFNTSANKWEAKGTGESKVVIYHNKDTNAFRLVGRNIADKSLIVINSNLSTSKLVYSKPQPTFHQYRDSRGTVYGFNFASPDVADTFATKVEEAHQALTNPAPKTPVPATPPVSAPPTRPPTKAPPTGPPPTRPPQAQAPAVQPVKPPAQAPPSGPPAPPGPPPTMASNAPPPPPLPTQAQLTSGGNNNNNNSNSTASARSTRATPSSSSSTGGSLADQLGRVTLKKASTNSTSSDDGPASKTGTLPKTSGGDFNSDLFAALNKRKKGETIKKATSTPSPTPSTTATPQPTSRKPAPAVASKKAAPPVVAVKKAPPVMDKTASLPLRSTLAPAPDAEKPSALENGEGFVTRAELMEFKAEMLADIKKLLQQTKNEIIQAITDELEARSSVV